MSDGVAALSPPRALRALAPAWRGGPDCALWLADLDVAPDAAEAADAGLDADEAARAARFVFVRDRARYVAAHRALRQVLGADLRQPPGRLRFETGAYGKPRLAREPATPELAFSLSHSEGLALIGTARDEIGVDIECLRTLPDLEGLADHCLTGDERRALRALAVEARAQAFLVAWTRKEACLKAVGCGLQVEPASFEVGLDAAPRDTAVPTRDGLVPLCVASVGGLDGAVAAVAMRRPARTHRGGAHADA